MFYVSFRFVLFDDGVQMYDEDDDGGRDDNDDDVDVRVRGNENSNRVRFHVSFRFVLFFYSFFGQIFFACVSLDECVRACVRFWETIIGLAF